MAGAGWGAEVDPEVHGCQGRALGQGVILEEQGNGEAGEQNHHVMSTVTRASLDLDSPIRTSCRQAIKCPLISDSLCTTSTSGALGLLAL